jgi:hypothetical protein
MKKKQILVLPFASTAIINEPSLCTDGSDLLLAMDFDDDGQMRSVRLRFVRQRAFRKRSEGHCTDWHVVDAFDTVCEVQDSDWVTELRNASAPEWRDHWVMHHFIIYIDSFGCLEVVAESVLFDDIETKKSGGT